MASAPLVTIGVPVFNGQAFLAGALRSLVAQTHRNIEIVVLDNASTDGTAEIVASFAAEDPRVRHVRNPSTIGILENFDAVAGLARGEFFMWAAHDDLWEPTYIEKLLGVFEASPSIGMAHAGYDLVSETGKILGVGKTQWFVSADSRVRELFSFSAKRGRLHNVCLHYLWRSPYAIYGLFRREVVLESLPFEYLFKDCNWADVVFLMNVYARHRAAHVDEVLFHSRVKNRETAEARSTYLAPGASLEQGPASDAVSRVLRRRTNEILAEAGFSRLELEISRGLLPALDALLRVRHAARGKLSLDFARGAR